MLHWADAAIPIAVGASLPYTLYLIHGDPEEREANGDNMHSIPDDRSDDLCSKSSDVTPVHTDVCSIHDNVISATANASLGCRMGDRCAVPANFYTVEAGLLTYSSPSVIAAAISPALVLCGLAALYLMSFYTAACGAIARFERKAPKTVRRTSRAFGKATIIT